MKWTKWLLPNTRLGKWFFLRLAETVLPETMLERQVIKRGPKIVAIGGGTGLSALLRGLKKYSSNLTAVVTVFDDGGSSGRLRGELGILPPGDIRNCLVAMADKETSMEQLFSYRFNEGSSLKGHNLGNLLIAAMTDIKDKDFDAAIQEISRVLAVRGQVLPATLTLNKLCAELVDGSHIEGESNFSEGQRPIKRVFMCPEECKPLDSTLEAIHNADLIVLGPGSLYTSVIPNLLVDGIPEALRESKAPLYYVCNIMTQRGETVGYSASEHIKALIDYGVKPDVAIINNRPIPKNYLRRYQEENATPVRYDASKVSMLGTRAILANLAELDHFVRHNSEELAKIIIKEALYNKQN